VSLPDPESLRVHDADEPSRVREGVGSRTANVAVAGSPDPATVHLTDEGYVGDGAATTGLLAVAHTVAADRDDCTLQYPDPDFTADGPWLVLAPLGGFCTTVATGTGRVVVTADYDADADPSFETLDARISTLADAVRPTHDHYPVADDAQGVFTTGMTTFSLDSVAVDGCLEVTFQVSTTPATTRGAVEARFADIECVTAVEYDPVAGVERADPSARLRTAVERAHREVTGDAQYDWLSDGDVFARIPGCEKMAFGTGVPKSDSFSEAEYETGVALLAATLDELASGREAAEGRR
jgi:hypothetical protein